MVGPVGPASAQGVPTSTPASTPASAETVVAVPTQAPTTTVSGPTTMPVTVSLVPAVQISRAPSPATSVVPVTVTTGSAAGSTAGSTPAPSTVAGGSDPAPGGGTAGTAGATAPSAGGPTTTRGAAPGPAEGTAAVPPGPDDEVRVAPRRTGVAPELVLALVAGAGVAALAGLGVVSVLTGRRRRRGAVAGSGADRRALAAVSARTEAVMRRAAPADLPTVVPVLRASGAVLAAGDAEATALLSGFALLLRVDVPGGGSVAEPGRAVAWRATIERVGAREPRAGGALTATAAALVGFTADPERAARLGPALSGLLLALADLGRRDAVVARQVGGAVDDLATLLASPSAVTARTWVASMHLDAADRRTARTVAALVRVADAPGAARDPRLAPAVADVTARMSARLAVDLVDRAADDRAGDDRAADDRAADDLAEIVDITDEAVRVQAELGGGVRGGGVRGGGARGGSPGGPVT
jgi:hypothetical protein